MNRTLKFFAFVCLIALFATAAAAQNAPAEARGKVVDHEDKPMRGVKLIFTNPKDPSTEYSATTNKRGQYFVGNLFHYPNSYIWNLKVEYEGYVPTHMKVYSTTQAAVADKYEADLPWNSKMPDMRIRPFGTAQVDLVMTPLEIAKTITPQGGSDEMEEMEVMDGGGGAAAAQNASNWDQALGLLAAGNTDAAMPLLEEAIEEAPEDAERVTTMAQVQYQAENYGQAARWAMQAAELDPQAIRPQMILYSVNIATNNLAGARAALAKAQEIDPENVEVLGQMAFVADQEGDIDTSIATYEKIVELDEQNTDAWTALGGLYAKKGENDKSSAAYEKVVAMNPEGAERVFYNIGALIMNKNNVSDADMQRAIGAFKKAIEINGEYAEAHQQLGFALLGTGDMAGARNALAEYVKLAPKAPDADAMKAMIEGLK